MKTEKKKTLLRPGLHTGAANAFSGPLTAEINVTESAITAITVTEERETLGIGSALTGEGYEGDTPLAVIPSRIIAAQSVSVPKVPGAAVTSSALIRAVKKALLAAGADIDEWTVKPETKPPQTLVAFADVVIIGAGGAGLIAAIAAAQNGAESVLLLEKNGAAGGDLLIGGGIYNCPDAYLQSKIRMTQAKSMIIESVLSKKPVSELHRRLQDKVKGEWEEFKKSDNNSLFDTPSWYALQTFDGGDEIGNLELIQIMCDNSEPAYRWINSLGSEFNDYVTQGAGSLWERTHSSSKILGTGFISAYVNSIAREKRIKMVVNTKANELLINENGEVKGVRATDPDGNEKLYYSQRGVILATGGFAANPQMVSEYNTSDKWKGVDLSKVKTSNRSSCSQGDGIKMALRAGAALTQMEHIQLIYLGNTRSGAVSMYPPRCVSGTDQIMFINKDGQRFVAEDGRRDEICLAVLSQPDGFFYVFESGDGHAPDLDKDLTADRHPLRVAEKLGYIFTGQTLDELAEKINVDKTVLKNTVQEFNRAAETGKDAWGRKLFTTKFSQGPYIATPRSAVLHHTMGGLVIDASCRVISAQGEIIKGLYAAGEVTGAIHGANRLGGNAVVDTVVFGKIAGAAIAADSSADGVSGWD
ncbi:MAG: FAD-dependent oxidoreductase [Desulfarculales bacterium]|nr:FAD-dependent oxidoreductase [Desulfarculales bacterium]